MQGDILLLSPAFLGSIDRYAAMQRAKAVIIDTSMPFNKRMKSTHRTEIIDANGMSMLTVPIEKPKSMLRARWTDIIVSAHDEWWNNLMTALHSAYGRTPFFEFYADDFHSLICRNAVGRTLMDLDNALDSLMRRLLYMTTPTFYGNPEEVIATEGLEGAVADYRTRPIDFTRVVEYYQVRAQRHGFQPHLSCVDLLFNMGPEAQLVLDKMVL
ncbi:MAG: WbqC family protein [Bacteroides sp.]|nr:WbqC family protein [Bacteroides sp.]MCM1413740.1 WbqC family protein [Bacteroides sp.]MCM1472241.1 WbqC family protein [Bacteroides sp.]